MVALEWLNLRMASKVLLEVGVLRETASTDRAFIGLVACVGAKVVL